MSRALTSFSDLGAISFVFLCYIHTIATCRKARNHDQPWVLPLLLGSIGPKYANWEPKTLDSQNSRHNSFLYIFFYRVLPTPWFSYKRESFNSFTLDSILYGELIFQDLIDQTAPCWALIGLHGRCGALTFDCKTSILFARLTDSWRISIKAL